MVEAAADAAPNTGAHMHDEALASAGFSSRNEQIRFPIVVAAIIGAVLIMALLGYSLIRQFRSIQIYNAGQAGSVYVEGFLAPHARNFVRDGTFPPEMHDDVRDLLLRLPAARHFDALKIWDTDGTLVFTTLTPDQVRDDDIEDLRRAASGTLVTELSSTGEEDHFPNAMLEIYAPIVDPDTGQIVAVGEIYQDARALLSERALIERSIWIAIGLATFGLLSMLVLVASQRRKLERQFAEEQRVASENRRLRIEADRSRLQASEANERLLNNVGAELHDGPIQLVSLLMLASEDGSLLAGRRQELLSQALTELRSISSGLILPEIHDLTLAQTLRLAIQRHQGLTGSVVDARIDALPSVASEPLRICLYRAVQEGLNNSWRYASGRGQTVEAREDDSGIVVIVRDAGPSSEHPVEAENSGNGDARVHLGHLGIRNRLEAFGGTLTFHVLPGIGTELVIRVPKEIST